MWKPFCFHFSTNQPLDLGTDWILQFQNSCNKLVITLRVVQLCSKIILVISNQTCTISKSSVWFQTKLHFTRFIYHYNKVALPPGTLNVLYTLGNDCLLSPRHGSLLITLRQNRSEKRGELCCRITMVATISTIFLDRDSHCFFNRWKKNMNYCLVPECNHAKKSHIFDFFLPYLQNHTLWRSRNLATMAMWHNNLSSLINLKLTSFYTIISCLGCKCGSTGLLFTKLTPPGMESS